MSLTHSVARYLLYHILCCSSCGAVIEVGIIVAVIGIANATEIAAIISAFTVVVVVVVVAGPSLACGNLHPKIPQYTTKLRLRRHAPSLAAVGCHYCCCCYCCC